MNFCFLFSSLNLDSCQGGITDAGLQCLASCYQLSSLVISYLDKVGPCGINVIGSLSARDSTFPLNVR